MAQRSIFITAASYVMGQFNKTDTLEYIAHEQFRASLWFSNQGLDSSNFDSSDDDNDNDTHGNYTVGGSSGSNGNQ